MPTHPAVLISTLGTKPQVVTTAVDLLLAKHYSLRDVIVLHTGGQSDPLASVIARLQEEFATYPAYKSLVFRLEPIPGLQGPLPDVETQTDAEAAFRAIYRAVLLAKRADQTVHLSIVGGRKVFAVYGMTAAQLLFDDDDFLWYVLVSGKFWAEERLHPLPGDKAQLVRVPVLRWGTLSPMLTDLQQIDDPFKAVERQRELRVQEQLKKAETFILLELTPRQREVAALLVREGLSDEDLAERLSLSGRTVGRHSEDIRSKAAAFWGLEGVSRMQLVALLGLYYAVAK